ncbi:hypothetical protein GUJ93_ZPchr0015g6840 [Zizania palustris]|uniref:Uncharacterized protein n=1 Tax=Zizania palustris TaxID=103762 RepID=A0A8J5SYV7_ZIZPA|nr:hypothetical protein GUJ93_ZPchr0015g6840 [Zizania palustris]
MGGSRDHGLPLGCLGVFRYFVPFVFRRSNGPLARRIKLIQVVARMMDTTVARYREIFGRVAALGILHHLEDVVGTISLATEIAPISFGGECLLAPLPGATAAWKAFQVA